MLVTLAVVVAALHAAQAKFAFPIPQRLKQDQWDSTYRLPNLAGAIATCYNEKLSSESGKLEVTDIQDMLKEDYTNITDVTGGSYAWITAKGWDAESVGLDVGEIMDTKMQSLELTGIIGCSVEPYCPADDIPAGVVSSPCNNGPCTLVVCLSAAASDASRSSKSRREAAVSRVYSLRDMFPKNFTDMMAKNLNSPRSSLGTQELEDQSKEILRHWGCDPFLQQSANLETIPWETVPGYKERNENFMRKRSQMKPIFERVFVFDESELADHELSYYREDTAVRLLQSVQRYSEFLRIKFERIACSLIPQCEPQKSEWRDIPLAVMVCVAQMSYKGPAPPPLPTIIRARATTPAVATTVPADATTVVGEPQPTASPDELATETTGVIEAAHAEMTTAEIPTVTLEELLQVTTAAVEVVATPEQHVTEAAAEETNADDVETMDAERKKLH